ncbi:MAG: DUF1127 domain-containing protein [Pseudomonadota bacterium]
MTTNILARAALPLEETGTFPVTDLLRSVVQGFTAWRSRCAAVRHLNTLDDDQLSDIGIARCDIERAVVTGLRSRR